VSENHRDRNGSRNIEAPSVDISLNFPLGRTAGRSDDRLQKVAEGRKSRRSGIYVTNGAWKLVGVAVLGVGTSHEVKDKKRGTSECRSIASCVFTAAKRGKEEPDGARRAIRKPGGGPCSS